MRICIRVLVFGSAFSAVAAPQPGFDARGVMGQVRTRSAPVPAVDRGEFLLDTSMTLTPAAYGQYNPALAFDGANFLLAWHDYRVGGYSDISGARVTPDVILLDSTGIIIAEADCGQRAPALAFDVTNFLAAWTDYRAEDSISDFYGARVTPQGTVQDPNGTPIGAAAGYQWSPSLVFDGTRSLVAWADGRAGGAAARTSKERLTSTGAVLDSGPMVTQTGS